NKYQTERLIDVELSKKDKEKLKHEEKKLEETIKKLREELDGEAGNVIYNNAFEWRFEFPEALDDEGNFVGFDVVIGNPPYYSLSKMRGFQSVFEKYSTYTKGADIYCLFYEKGWQILNNKGLLTFITSNSWLRSQYGEPLRKFFVEKVNPKVLINFEDVQLFEEATVESNILLVKKEVFTNQLKYVAVNGNTNDNLKNYFDRHGASSTDLDLMGWSLGNRIENELKKKIETHSTLIKNLDVTMNYGIKTGFNDAFFIDSNTKEKLLKENPQLTEFVKPAIRGRDISKYSLASNDVFLILIKNGWTNSITDEIDKESFLKNKFPSLYNHFRTINDTIKGKGKGLLLREDQGDYWWELRPCAYYDDFEKEKIIWGELSNKPKFAYDDNKLYANNTIFFIVGKNLKYLLAILNSKLSEWYFNQIATSSGMGTNRWLKYKVELLPIKDITEKEQKPIVILVDKILSAKKKNPQADTSALETEIDNLVYQLYGLTEEEINIVEGKV
ncbi:MAG: TaqI-like C-terminal specificity domain-containing protein, partial [Ignavibacteria bacterium]|nr:TaqI-like C-terminal specificity domain-containing protein [Ignavibacteria bacterium]